MTYEDGSPLTDPRLVQIDLHNTGSAAIGKEMYDGTPYIVRFGAKVIDKVDEKNSLPDRTAPDARVRDSELWIGPGTIHPHQQLSYSVLVDGPTEVQLVSPLKNVKPIDLVTWTEAVRSGRRLSVASRLIASSAALVLLGGGIGSAAAAQQAMPGDTLYGMKRAIEDFSTSVSIGDGPRGRRELDHAKTRLYEIRVLVSNGGDVATINSTLADFSDQTRKGVTRLVASYQQDLDPASITAVAAFITSARQVIAELAPKLPPEPLKAAVETLMTIDDLARQSAAACPTCEKPKPANFKPTTG